MKPRKPFARIAITLPEEDLAAADRLAAELDRSRSWVIAEALRRYAGTQTAPVSETVELDEFRREQLQRDLALTPEERVRLAEETASIDRKVGEPRVFADYYAFRAATRLGGGAA